MNSLNFSSLNEVLRHARWLENTGYQPLGHWNLAQTCHHLACWMSYPIKGFPKAPVMVAIFLGILRITVGKSSLRKILSTGIMPNGTPTMPETVCSPDTDTGESIARLAETIRAFEKHAGPIHPSPLFGSLDKETAHRLQLVHARHHFRMLKPLVDNE